MASPKAQISLQNGEYSNGAASSESKSDAEDAILRVFCPGGVCWQSNGNPIRLTVDRSAGIHATSSQRPASMLLSESPSWFQRSPGKTSSRRRRRRCVRSRYSNDAAGSAGRSIRRSSDSDGILRSATAALHQMCAAFRYEWPRNRQMIRRCSRFI